MRKTLIAKIAKRNALVESHLDLVRPIAQRLALTLPRAFELEDLIHTGYLGLIEAAARYQPGKHGGAPFAAYARQKVRGSILDSVRRGHYIEATRQSLEAADEPEPMPYPIETTLDARRQALRVAAAVAVLPARQRSAVRLRYEETLRFPAVGRSLGVGKSAAQKIHRTAILALRVRLAG